MSKKPLVAALLLIALTFASFPLPVMGSLAIVSIQPRTATVWGTEETFTVNVTVADVTNLYGWEIQLYYDHSILSGIDVSEGQFLKSAGQTFFNFTVNDDYDATRGRIKAFGSLVGQIPGVNGTGTLFTVTLKTVDLGITVLDLGGVILADVGSNLIPYGVLNGGVEVVPAVRDVAVQKVSVSSNIVVSGQVLEMYVTAANLGNETETFNVTAYCNETVVTEQVVDGLPAQTSVALTLRWDTSSVTPNSTCMIKVEASQVPEETVLENNVFVYGAVAVIRGVHDVAVISVSTSSDRVYAGDAINIRVAVVNKGNYTETFNVTVYRDGAVINVQNVENLTYGGLQDLVFVWDTDGVVSNKTYKINAVASAVAGEVNLGDNSLTDGNVTVYPLGALSIKIVEVVPSDQLGRPVTSFLAGTTANFKLTLNCTLIGAKAVLVTINIHDAKGNTIGVVSFQGPVASGVTTFMMGLPMPKTAAVGNATVYADALSDWPHLGGTPYCPEKSATFQIRGS